jgi:hypothetical protein
MRKGSGTKFGAHVYGVPTFTSASRSLRLWRRSTRKKRLFRNILPNRSGARSVEEEAARLAGNMPAKKAKASLVSHCDYGGADRSASKFGETRLTRDQVGLLNLMTRTMRIRSSFRSGLWRYQIDPAKLVDLVATHQSSTLESKTCIFKNLYPPTRQSLSTNEGYTFEWQLKDARAPCEDG